MRWLVRIAIVGAELTFFWLIVIACVSGAIYSIYQMVVHK